MENANITIPQGNSPEDIKARKNIIFNFYQSWKIANPEQRRYNISLGEYINIRSISIDETAAKASRNYLSTLAVLQLDAILTGAMKVDMNVAKAKNKNQKGFTHMIIMEYNCPGIGTIKMTVGVKIRTKMKVQYCITALEA